MFLPINHFIITDNYIFKITRTTEHGRESTKDHQGINAPIEFSLFAKITCFYMEKFMEHKTTSNKSKNKIKQSIGRGRTVEELRKRNRQKE